MPCRRNEKNADDAAIPWGAFPIGSVAGGTANEREEYGLTVDLAADRNVVGLVSAEQVPSSLPAVAQDGHASQNQSVKRPGRPLLLHAVVGVVCMPAEVRSASS